MSAYNGLATHYELMYEGNYHALQEDDVDWLDGIFEQYGVQRVLDASCGDGIHAIPLAQQGYHLTGSDLSRSMIRQAKHQSRNAGVHFPLYALDFRRLDKRFNEHEFDAVLTLGHSLSHVLQSEQTAKALQQMNHVLRPGGLCIVDLPDMERVRSSPALSRGISKTHQQRTTIVFSHRRYQHPFIFLDLYHLTSRAKGMRAKKYSIQLRIWEIAKFETLSKNAGFDLLQRMEASGGRGHVFLLRKP